MRRAVDDQRAEAGSQSGFTLVELLISVAVMTLLVGVMSTAFVVGVRVFAGARDLIEGSGQVQLATSRFVADGMSAEQVRSSESCGDDGTSFLRGFTWNIGPDDDTSTAVFADWYLDEVSVGDSTTTVVVRAVCGTASAGPDTLMAGVLDASIDCVGRTCTFEWERGSSTDGTISVARRADDE